MNNIHTIEIQVLELIKLLNIFNLNPNIKLSQLINLLEFNF